MGLRAGDDPAGPLVAVARRIAWPSGEVLHDGTPPVDGVSAATGDPVHHLGAGFRQGSAAVLCTRTGVVKLDDGGGWTTLASHRWFSDLHNVADARGLVGQPEAAWLVSSTGNEAVHLLARDGRVLRSWWLGGAVDGERFGGLADFRAVRGDAFKPHRVHPNFVFVREGRAWVTALHAKAAWDLDNPAVRIELPEGAPHDGLLRDGWRWFTTVNGWLIAVDDHTLGRRLAIDLPAQHHGPETFGWLRGVEVVGDRVWVGVTMLRKSRWIELARRAIRGAAGDKLPTRVLELDRGTGRVVRSVTVGGRSGGNLYGLLAMG